jgi:hypothetical protein
MEAGLAAVMSKQMDDVAVAPVVAVDRYRVVVEEEDPAWRA